MLKQDYPEEWEKLSIKLRFDENEISIWSEIAESLYIACDYNQKLYLEDDRYLSRAPFDLKKGKPTTKRVIDSTLPYESLAMYQVTKQADVITLMNLIPNKFTKEEKQIAWEFYEPKTAHDSSLSYSPHAIMAARLGYIEDALSYFRKAAFVDLDNLKLNSISGLHFANFGGTWQAIVFGFVGLDAKENELTFEPNVPDEWGHIEFTMHFRGWLLRVKVENKWMQIVPLTANDNSIKIVYKKDFAFLKKDDSEVVLQNS
jgi:trehalose/maltose hydrolase-like predicted phosphorylase